MAGKTPEEATDTFLDPLARALRCVWSGHVYTRVSSADPTTHVLMVNRGQLISLGCKDGGRLQLQIAMLFQHEQAERGQWTVSTREYIYAFSLPGLEKHPFLAYHWHPFTTPQIAYPHLHVERGATDGAPLTHRTHVPTGHMTLAEVLRLAITQFDVTPLRVDWEETLKDAQATLDQFRS